MLMKESLQKGDENNAFVNLHKLLTQLKDLHSLHTKYKCYLSLDQYVKVCLTYATNGLSVIGTTKSMG